ncbi:MAG: 3-isopropylmalate dehydrogenase [Synergistaceae bacterium]|nr:3-isopropylmalate dehydrogenase [Synergistaceae bacterium]
MDIAVIRGDGIGPEIVNEALNILNIIAKKFKLNFNYKDVYMGGCAIDKFGEPLPDESVKACLASDAVLLGAVGGPKWDSQPPENRPEKGLLKLRNALGVYANIRPARMFNALKAACPLRDDIAAKGIDFIVVRELTGGIYFGEHFINEAKDFARDVMTYSELEIKRIAKIAFETARIRNKKVTSVDKANVLASSRIWRQIVSEMRDKDYSDIELNHMYVDNAAMQIVKDPSQFDVILTENMFGDILSDEASQITGSIGLIPSASLGADNTPWLYEPIHGSAPDIAGQNKANPIGTILAAAMMLRYSFKLEDAACAIEQAVNKILNDGWRTGDIFDAAHDDKDKLLGCSQMAKVIGDAI